MTTQILAIDQGTTGSTIALFDSETLNLSRLNKQEFKQHYPTPGWVEHDPEEIWQSVLAGIEALKLEKDSSISCIGITNQRETVVAWDRETGKAASNAIVWQDRRTARRCQELNEKNELTTKINAETGLVIDPYFSASKMEWLLNNCSEVQNLATQNRLCFGTVDTYIIYRLTGGKSFVTDHTNASRTMLYSLKDGDYKDWLLELFGIKRTYLPTIRPSVSDFGVTRNVPGLMAGIPITGCIGDQQAALFGQECHLAGQAKITFGTGAFILVNTGDKVFGSTNGLLGTVAFATETKRSFALEGSAFIAGAAVQFLRDNFGWIMNSHEVEGLAVKDKRDPNLIFIPALAGLGAPYWNPNAKGALLGLTRGATKSQITRAVLEGIVLQNIQLLKLVEQITGEKIARVSIDGKAALNDFLMQLQADLLGLELTRPDNVDTTALGAALAAKWGIDGQNAKINRALKSFKPLMSPGESISLIANWEKAVHAIDQLYR